MIRAVAVLRPAELFDHVSGDTITLDRDARYRRRIAMTTDQGQAFLLDLSEATYLAHGDVLELTSGGFVQIIAAPEDLLAVHAHDPAELARIAWHIGNRHTPAEITAQAIYIKPDHVLAEMVTGLGGHVHTVKRAFEPEGGAYGGKGPIPAGHHHHHDH